MLTTTVENYKKAKDVYKEIDDKFYKIQHGEIEDSEFQINQILNRLKDFEKYLRYVQTKDLTEKYTKETIEAVNQNMEIFKEALYFWQRFFLGAKYSLGLKEPLIEKYVPGLNLEHHEIEKWGGSNKKVALKLIGALTHPDRVLEYEKSIKRIILGTMIQREFNRIFEVIKHKMIPVPKKFVSIDQFKKEDIDKKEDVKQI